jgi:hypothetical protein
MKTKPTLNSTKPEIKKPCGINGLKNVEINFSLNLAKPELSLVLPPLRGLNSKLPTPKESGTWSPVE